MGLRGSITFNAVDEVTQWQVIFTVERISEQFMIPALEAMPDAFPFTIIGFHADNGSEYINHMVVKLLDKLRIELTKSRSRQTNDNALAESKHGSTVRKIQVTAIFLNALHHKLTTSINTTSSLILISTALAFSRVLS